LLHAELALEKQYVQVALLKLIFMIAPPASHAPIVYQQVSILKVSLLLLINCIVNVKKKIIILLINSDLSCFRCPTGCDTCKRDSFCDKCVSGQYLGYLMNIGEINGVCKPCDKTGEYIDIKFSSSEGSGVCLTHSEFPIKNCIKCSNKFKEYQNCE
jgi:hypothetical protein